jgi:hypothetical protein
VHDVGFLHKKSLSKVYGGYMVSCSLNKDYVSVEKCMFCDFCKGSVVEEGKTITFCTFSKDAK